jgi:prepilin-type N-terminal cleavage/methylation domain-containing protein
MKIPEPDRGRRGFTLIELLVVLAIAMILMAISVPALWTAMHQAKMRGVSQETAVLLRQARLEAVKRSAQAVVRILPAAAAGDREAVEAFSDLNSDGKLSAGEPILGRVELPTGVYFKAPPELYGVDSVDKFSPDLASASLPHVATFLSSGAIEKLGAFRFGDTYGNFLEVRVAPEATARVEVRKCSVCTDADDDTDWYASGDGGTRSSANGWKAWEWK